jgi:hypothetical protein
MRGQSLARSPAGTVISVAKSATIYPSVLVPDHDTKVKGKGVVRIPRRVMGAQVNITTLGKEHQREECQTSDQTTRRDASLLRSTNRTRKHARVEPANYHSSMASENYIVSTTHCFSPLGVPQI